MKRKLCSILILILVLALPQSALAWNPTGHQVVARIAWEHMTPTARQNAVALLQAAPPDACLRNLFPNDSRPLEARQREFFMLASTWPDIVRNNCTSFNRSNWHYINFFWRGVSGDTTNNPPQDAIEFRTPETNIVERLRTLRSVVVSNSPRAERATTLAWILHLVGDIHQPLHTSARVTTREDERQGDQGGNLFKVLNRNGELSSLHGYWDGIVDEFIRRQPRSERDRVYFERVANGIMRKHPRSSMVSRLRSGQFEAWAREGFTTTKNSVYPRELIRNQRPGQAYRQTAFTISEQAIALSGYRLAELLNQSFGS